jgi:tetratricopeptide (TPR) repeat protein
VTCAQTCRILAVFLVFVSAGHAQERDLREQFGTTSLEAATQIQRALQLSQAKKPSEALVAVDEAIKADKLCQMCYFQKASYLNSLGRVEDSIAAYKTCLSDDVRRSRRISATAAVNLAIVYAKLKEFDESGNWFTRAILEDYDNSAGQRGKAYRNLAIALREKGKHLTAALAVAFAFEDKAPNCDLRMVRDFFDKAENDEGARLLHFAEKSTVPVKRTLATGLTRVTPASSVSGPVTELLADPLGRFVVAFTRDSDSYWIVSTGDKPDVRKLSLPQKLTAACLAEGYLYVASRDPAQIQKVDAESGKVLATYALKSAPTNSIAVLPAQGRAYFPANDVINEVDLASGTVTRTKIPGQDVVAHPNQRFLYSFTVSFGLSERKYLL